MRICRRGRASRSGSWSACAVCAGRGISLGAIGIGVGVRCDDAGVAGCTVLYGGVLYLH